MNGKSYPTGKAMGSKGGGSYASLPSTGSESEGGASPGVRLPPKVKKRIKAASEGKKSSYKSVVSSDTSVCSLWTMLKIITVIVVLATVAVLGVICYWLMGQVYEMKSQLQQIQQAPRLYSWLSPKW